MPSQTIQWFPGHMAKTRRLITEYLPQIDIVIELLDARIPRSSKNPEIDKLIGNKPHLILLTKSSLANANATKQWENYYAGLATEKKTACAALAVDSMTGEGMRDVAPMIRTVLSDKIERYANKGMEGRKLRAMLAGIPNVGKSSLINRLSGGKRTKVEDRPGVTRTAQWVTTNIGVDLLDMPGVLWPKFEDDIIGQNLAFTGAIKDDILDIEELASLLCDRLYRTVPDMFCTRYKLDRAALADRTPYELLCAVAKKRGFLISGGELDTERAAEIVLDEFREAKIGRITLELPEQKTQKKPKETTGTEDTTNDRPDL